MRIDSGLSSQYYQNRYVPEQIDSEDAAPETVATTRSASNPAFSKTLLSSHLASALWGIEGGKKNGASAGTGIKDFGFPTTAEKVEAVYMEFSDEQ
ncbi:hypothetical protein ACQQ2Q_02570 [Agrobacterium sp. ES01]|uniref:hypothetical protein n=1 Tax=Agrobacterium sp. ES01 TaxID=3420714 RepID=UPI003D0F5923